MHKVKAAERRNGPPKISGGKKKEDGGGGRVQAVKRPASDQPSWIGGVMGEGWHNLAVCLGGWLLSTRFVGSLCFVFGLLGRSFHLFDPLLQDHKSSFPSYLYCPSITFISTVVILIGTGMQNAHSLPQVLTMVSCCGVLAGAIIEEQLEEMPYRRLGENDFIFMTVACIVLSFCVYVLGYGWNVSMRGVLKRAILIVTPIWSLVLYQVFTRPSIPLQLGLFLTFTLTVGIVEYYVTDVRGRVPIFSSVFPAPYIGCMVQSFGMVALTTYHSSLRLSFFSDSWLSFAWMVFAGPPLGVFTLVCHLIYWTSEKIFGPGRHNTVYVIRSVLFAWAVALAVHQFGLYDKFPKLRFW